jgi:hypothetical protein
MSHKKKDKLVSVGAKIKAERKKKREDAKKSSEKNEAATAVNAPVVTPQARNCKHFHYYI